MCKIKLQSRKQQHVNETSWIKTEFGSELPGSQGKMSNSMQLRHQNISLKGPIVFLAANPDTVREPVNCPPEQPQIHTRNTQV